VLQHEADRGHPVTAILGHSNGGAMALRLGCEAPELARVVVVVAPPFFADTARCTAATPVGLVLFHGENDRVVPFAGGPLKPIHPRSTAAPSASAESIVRRFAAINGCAGAPREEALDLDDNATRDGDPRETRHLSYLGCKAPVEFYAMAGVGHAVAQPTATYWSAVYAHAGGTAAVPTK
jgi:polyhydroxybutyrate depolymerase